MTPEFVPAEPASTAVSPEWTGAPDRPDLISAMGRYLANYPSELKQFEESTAQAPLESLGGIIGGALQSIPTPPSRYLKKLQEMDVSPEVKGGAAIGEHIGKGLQAAALSSVVPGTGIPAQLARSIVSEVPYLAGQEPGQSIMDILTDLASGMAVGPLMSPGVSKELESETGAIRAFHGSSDPNLVLKAEGKASPSGSRLRLLGAGLYSTTDPVSAAHYAKPYADVPGGTLYELELHPGKKASQHRYVDYTSTQKGLSNPPADFVSSVKELVPDEELQYLALRNPQNLPLAIAATRDPEIKNILIGAIRKSNNLQELAENAGDVLTKAYINKHDLLFEAENEVRRNLMNKGYSGARGVHAAFNPKKVDRLSTELVTFDPTDVRIVNKWPSESMPDAWKRKLLELYEKGGNE